MTALTTPETESILTLCLMASFADGDKHERERQQMKKITDSLANEEVDVAALYQRVLLNRPDLTAVAKGLVTPGSRQLAYEMAVCVCDADGALSAIEQRFLDNASSALGLDVGASSAFRDQAQAIAAVPVNDEVVSGAGINPGAVDPSELDSAILNAAIVNGALELLPETLSTMAIIPLQMKLVYRIGKAHGFELDSGHVKDFLATAGVGLTSQYLERAGRKLLGGLLGRVGGGILGGMGRQAVSSGMSFASTYALGHVAKAYYAGGRKLSTQMLKEAYARTLQEAQGLRERYLPEIQAKARTLDARSLLSMVRGS